MEKSADAFRTISEAADDLRLPQHVLRFWETRFTQIKPMKRGGGRRYYRPDDMDLLRAIQHLLYDQGFTIRGVQRLLKERGVRAVAALRTDGIDASARAALLEEKAVAPDQPMPPVEPSNMEAGGAPGEWRLESVVITSLRAALSEIVEAQRLLAAARAR
jgi:DNA-binding transcriptional MerR regulator